MPGRRARNIRLVNYKIDLVILWDDESVEDYVIITKNGRPPYLALRKVDQSGRTLRLMDKDEAKRFVRETGVRPDWIRKNTYAVYVKD